MRHSKIAARFFSGSLLFAAGCSLLVDTGPYLSVCSAEQYAVYSSDDAPPRCVDLTVCADGQYETLAPTFERDRRCAAVSECAGDEYEVAAPTPTRDRVCAAISECAEGEYEAAAPAPARDRVCAAVSECAEGEYETASPTSTSDRVCAPRPVASLTHLRVSSGILDPPFHPEQTEYTVDVGLFAEAFWVEPSAYPADAILEVDGVATESGAASPAVTLDLGDENTITVEVTSADGSVTRVYTVQVDRASQVLQQAYVKASNAGAGATEEFGTSVALHGDTLVVGAPNEDGDATGVDGHQTSLAAPDSGAVYVFTRAGSTWTQQAYIKASNTGADDRFGSSVALHGDTLVVGAPLEDSASAGIDGDQGDDSAENSGAVYVFTRAGSTWAQQAYIKASNTREWDIFGHALALHGDTLAVGAPSEDGDARGIDGHQTSYAAPDSGAVYVFTRAGTTWTQQAYIKAANADAGDRFGTYVALYGDTLAASSYNEGSSATGIDGDADDDAASGSGAVYVFTRADATWTQEAYVKASNTDAGDRFGTSIALDGDTLAVGAPYESSSATGVDGNQADNSASGGGAAYVFTRAGATWTQRAYVKASNTDAGDYFGWRIALHGDTLAVAARGEDSGATGVGGDQESNSASSSGAVYVFTRAGATWAQRAYVKASNTEAFDAFGQGLALNGDTLAVGAPGERSAATGIDGDQDDNSAPSSGAVFVFR